MLVTRYFFFFFFYRSHCAPLAALMARLIISELTQAKVTLLSQELCTNPTPDLFSTTADYHYSHSTPTFVV